MTPIGHLAVSYISGKSNQNIFLPAIMIGGLLPDIDFLFIFFTWFNQVHRVITHNLFFVIFASLIAMAFSVKGKKQVVGLSLFLGGMLHLMIDSAMDNNPGNGIGVALLWPLSYNFFSPFNLFDASPDSPGWNEPVRMLGTLIPGMFYEIPFYIISIFLYLKQKK